MVLGQTQVSEKFGPISKSQRRFGWVSQSRSLESVVFSFRLVFRSRPEFFRVSWQQLIELSYQIKMIIKQEKAVNWWASANFHCRFWSVQLALLICTIVNFWRLESRGSEFFRSKVSGSELIKTLKSRSRILKPVSNLPSFSLESRLSHIGQVFILQRQLFHVDMNVYWVHVVYTLHSLKIRQH